MNSPFPELDEVIERYNSILQEAQVKAIFVRGIELQEKKIDEANELIKELQQYKEKSVKEKNEIKANLLLCLILVAQAVIAELQLIIELKKDNPGDAWSILVQGQKWLSLAIQNHPFNGDYLLGYSKRLNLYEILLFPNQKFASIGGVVKYVQCSICGENNNECTHIAGKAYMGEICSRIITEIDFEEISLVDHPADKSCRVLSFDNKGKRYDVFTHREILNPEN